MFSQAVFYKYNWDQIQNQVLLQYGLTKLQIKQKLDH